jgi:hypothetical protein
MASIIMLCVELQQFGTSRINPAFEGNPDLSAISLKACMRVGMAAGRVLFGYNNTRPEIVPETSTNIHTHQANQARNYTRTHTHQVSTGYRVSSGYVIVD